MTKYPEEKYREKVTTINPPVYSGSTVLFESCEDLWRACEGTYPGIVYGTDRMPTQREFEEKLRALEGGFATRAFQSGISAICNTLLAFVQAGDHVLVCENVYGPTAAFCRKILTKYNVEIEFIPAAIGEGVGDYLKDNTRLIFLESPGSNTFEIQDLRTITQAVTGKDIVTVLDNTWATPLYLNPFELGVDVSIHSVTKYISGHSDILLGTASVNSKYAEQFIEYYKTLELFASPQDCYLALRGLQTLAVRMKQHESSALRLARWLESESCVEKVIHPGLPSHPQHDLWNRDFSGSSGLFAFTLAGGVSPEKIAEFVNELKLFGIGFSWGGFKSLITAGAYVRNTNPELSGKMLIRLNVGLEDVDELEADLRKGFEVL